MMAEAVNNKKEGLILYRCPECGLHYRDEKDARYCEAWCREHHSCNIEITVKAVESAEKLK